MVADFHLHFVTADRTTEHILEIALNQGKVSLSPVHQLDIYLPETKSFAHANLSSDELDSAIKKSRRRESNLESLLSFQYILHDHFITNPRFLNSFFKHLIKSSIFFSY